MSKHFLTHWQQMKKLRDDKKIGCSGKDDKSILVKHGYFNLINGYKLPFSTAKDMQRNHTYEQGTHIQNLHSVKEFDDALRLILFKHISRVEEEIRTLASYKFDEVNKNGQVEWYQIEAYNISIKDLSKPDIAEMISKVLGDIKRSHSDYLKHYKNNHNVIPTWILFKVINFNTFLSVLYASKDKVKQDLCNLYGIADRRSYPDYKLLLGSLHFMRKIRNSCAHNERVFDICTPGQINCTYATVLPNVYRRNREGNKKLLDFILYLRYYTDDSNYVDFIDEIYNLLLNLESKISTNSYDYVRGKMGIKNKEHLLLLKSISKDIDYSAFS